MDEMGKMFWFSGSVTQTKIRKIEKNLVFQYVIPIKNTY